VTHTGDFNTLLTVTRDGRTLVFDHQTRSGDRILTQDVWTIGADGKGAHALSTTPDFEDDPVVFANGTRIAYSNMPAGARYRSVWTASPDGSGATNVTQAPDSTYDRSVAVSPEGSKLLFTEHSFNQFSEPVVNGGLFAIGVDGTGRIQIAPANVDVADFSPDGSRIAYVVGTPGSEATSVVVVNADGTGSQTIAAAPAGYFYGAAHWSPDGTRIIAGLTSKDTRPDRLVTMSTDGSDLKDIAVPANYQGNATWAPAVAGASASCDVTAPANTAVDVTGTAKNDTLTGGKKNDVLDGGAGSDKLSGGAGNDTLSGGKGNDTLDGGKGIDKLDGGPGNDKILSADGKKETVVCGSGKDTVTADKKDKLKGCETVKLK
jgi:Ca2+-binding RTX toxin-like protein